MARRDLSDDELRATVALYNRTNSYVETGRLLGIGESSVRGRIGRAIMRGIMTEQAEAVANGNVELTVDERIAKQLESSEARNRMLVSQIATLRRQVDEDSSLREKVFGLAEQDTTAPKWTHKPSPAAKSGPGIPILMCSDFQLGEVVSANELDGINAFNLEIAERRYQKLIRTTIDICYRHTPKATYDGIVYIRGGDMVSGDIHEELRKTNELAGMPAMIALVRMEKAGIDLLLQKFNRVYVISVPGNHGRTTEKPHSKGYTEANYDYISGLMLEAYYAGDPRVTFMSPVSGDAVFRLFNYRFLITHGDRIGSRGGQGFVGPSATVARGAKKLRDYYATLNKPIDYIFMGHFHTRMELDDGVFVNGCLPGYSEYARDFRFRPSVPEQWLVFCHPNHGITSRWPIALESRMTLKGTDTQLFAQDAA